MKLTKFLLASSSVFFINQQAIATSLHGDETKTNHTVTAKQNKPEDSADTTQHGSDVTAASSTQNQNFQWTVEQSKWIARLVTQPGDITIVSRRYPQSEVDQMGLAEASRTKNPIDRRIKLVRAYLDHAHPNSLAGFPEAVKSKNCPPETVFLYLQNLERLGQTEEVRAIIIGRHSDSFQSIETFNYTQLHPLEFPFFGLLGSSKKNEFLCLTSFLKWQQNDRTGLGKLFQATSIALILERIADLADSEGELLIAIDYMKAAFGLHPTSRRALFIASTYSAMVNATSSDPQSTQWKNEIENYNSLVSSLERKESKPLNRAPTTRTVLCTKTSSVVLPTTDSAFPGEGRALTQNDLGRLDPNILVGLFLEEHKALLSLSPEDFVANPDHLRIFYAGLCLLNRDNIKNEQDVEKTLQKINERLPKVSLDLKTVQELAQLWPKFSRTKHGPAITSIQETLRRIITDAVNKNKQNFLAIAHLSNLPGLVEEAAFIHFQGVPPLDPQPIQVDNVQINPLHMTLCEAKVLPRNVCQILREASISRESDLYKHWEQKWNATYGVQEREQQAAFVKEIKAFHQKFLAEPLVVASSGQKQIGRTTARGHSYNDDSTSAETSSSEKATPSYDSAGIMSEAWRRASEREYAIPPDVLKSLRLEVRPSSGGGSRSEAILFHTTHGREERLASFRPHQLHPSDLKAGEEITQEKVMTMLWNFHRLQKPQEE